jgi:hypothetical protein
MLKPLAPFIGYLVLFYDTGGMRSLKARRRRG